MDLPANQLDVAYHYELMDGGTALGHHQTVTVEQHRTYQLTVEKGGGSGRYGASKRA